MPNRQCKLFVNGSPAPVLTCAAFPFMMEPEDRAHKKKKVNAVTLETYFPVWNKLHPRPAKPPARRGRARRVEKGTVLHNGSMDCTGLLVVKSGQLRAFILSDEGREITLYRLFDRDICLFSAACMMRSAQFEVTVEAEKDTELWVIPAEVYRGIMEEFRTGGQLHQRADGGPVFRCDVADRADHVEEPGQAPGRVSAGGSRHRGEPDAEDHA